MQTKHPARPRSAPLPDLIDMNKIVSAADEMEPLSPTIVKLSAMILDPFTSIKEMAHLIAFDQGLTLKLLKAANAAYVGSAMRITNVSDAITFIGEYQTLNLLLSRTIGEELMASALNAYDYSEGQLWSESVIASLAAEQCVRIFRKPLPQTITTAALLHNVGKVILSRFISSEIKEKITLIKSNGKNTADAEKEILNIHYGEVGALIAQHWGLPHEIVAGIRFHQQPELVQSETSDVTHVCSGLVEHFCHQSPSFSESHDVQPNVVKRLEPKSENWFEKLSTYVENRFNEVGTSYGISSNFTLNAHSVHDRPF